ncbi:MAG: hypothetical protein H0U76_17120 [Ktedonobacteraceae bacterium]|nr:hypothetical protein [Ktedonobacteraceae bacterium]
MDLWAESDHNDTLPVGASENGRVPTQHRPRRLTDSAILSLFRTWLLQDYVPPYCRSLAATRIFRRCYWIDGLGIEGRRRADTTIDTADQPSTSMEQASKSRKKSAPAVVPPAMRPLVALSEALAQESKPIHLRGLILEAGSSKSGRRTYRSEHVKEQKQEYREIRVPAEGGILQASWLEAASNVLREIEQSPAIFLLNPLSPALFTYDDLAPLYQRTVPTELCLLLPHKQIETRLPAAHKNQMLAATLTGLLRSNRWKALPLEEEKRDEAITGFLDLFLASMQRHFQLPPQRIILPVTAGPASVAPLPYTLIYATRRQDSLLSMNDAVCLYQRRVYQQSYHGVLGEEWFASQEQAHHIMDLQLLARRVQQQGTTLRIRRWPDLRQQLLLANFGQFTSDEYDTIIRHLLSTKEVSCIWRTSAGEPGERTPGVDDNLQWK